MKIMQCWDDGVVNDARLADLLRKYGAKATFNLNPALHLQHERKLATWRYKDIFPVDKLSLDEMKDVYRGFKVAGHTMTHPHLTKCDPETVRKELVDCITFLREFFGQERCGFAYPFGDYNAEVAEAVRAAGYLYARTCENVDGPLPLNKAMTLPSHCHFMCGDFWQKYERVKAENGVFYFWGHSYEMMDDPALWDGFEAKLARIREDKAEWIDIVDLFPQA